MVIKLKSQPILYSWTSLFVFTISIAFLYVLMEWLFIITKPSTMSILSFPKKFQVFLFSSSLMAAGCSFVLLALFVIGAMPRLRSHQQILIKLGALLPAGILASIMLLMVDNFSYTIFHFGIVTSKGVFRGLYALGYIIVFGGCLRYIWKILAGAGESIKARKLEKPVFAALIGVVVFSFTIPVFLNDFKIRVGETRTTHQLKNHPHIIFITADGVNAISMSVYGYNRDTTPRIKELAKTSLVAENAFTNCTSTACSLISAFTGKYPAKTRMIYPPDVLRDENAYQHLPGILRVQGYYAVQMSVPHYGDAYTLNLLNGFDEANGRAMEASSQLMNINQYISTDFAYFIYEMSNRLLDRLRHIFFVKVMENPYDLVMNPPNNIIDQIKIDNAIKLIRKSKKPLFFHIHLMGTHGSKFYPQKQVFSIGQNAETQEEWNTDFYDDSILLFDRHVGEIIDALKKIDLFDKSILIISSDHGYNNIRWKRIPLIIHFPEGQYAGSIESNVQTIDIAPTILDFLGLEKPIWMSGNSLISRNFSQRVIFTTHSTSVERGENGNFVVKKQDKYFKQIGKISIEFCQKWYSIDLHSYQFDYGEIEGYTVPCQKNKLITDAEAFRLMRDHLKENGFDVSPLNYIYSKLFSSEE